MSRTPNRQGLCPPWLVRWVLAWLVVAGCGTAQAEPQVGVFYFPGWRDNTPGAPSPKPWEPIKAWPDRQPRLGWYDEGQVPVMSQHLAWMADHRISFVVFDYYWAERPILAHAVQAYQASAARQRVRYALMWANHDEERPRTLAEFDGMVADLVTSHLRRPEYLQVQGQPVLMVMVPGILEARTRALGLAPGALVQRLHKAVRQAGLPDLMLLAGAGAAVNEVTQNARRWGYGGYFAYNYHAGVDGRTRGEPRASHSYLELDEDYRTHWDWFLTRGDMPYVMPLTSGWDMRPWGGSADKLHDQSISTPAEFTLHLQAARQRMLAQPARSLGLGVICCWNEFGEGSFIEPTQGFGSRHLEAVKSVFGGAPR
jgi:hypothetical protein